MRATVSYLAAFDRTFIPEANLIGSPGQYLRNGWQARFTPHYAASFLRAAEAAAEQALTHVRTSGRERDPYVQHPLARMTMNLDSSHLWLRHTASLWERGEIDEAMQASSKVRWLIEHWAEAVVDDAVRVCGARGLNRPSALERILRDLSFDLRHDNNDQILATIGRAVLGEAHDPSFHRALEDE